MSVRVHGCGVGGAVNTSLSGGWWGSKNRCGWVCAWENN